MLFAASWDYHKVLALLLNMHVVS